MLDYEKSLRGYKLIAGVDEAGRGPLAGPVAVAAAVMPEGDANAEINDSKQLSESARSRLFEYIRAHALAYEIELIDAGEIDRLNIYRATKVGMERVISRLKVRPDLVLIDAMKGVPSDCPNIPLIKGDTLSYNIAAASILAKVTRDEVMRGYDKIYPEYGFARHKGYPTPEHIAALKKHGACPIHRKSFLKNFQNDMPVQQEFDI